jgi:hypothetical protein
VYSPEVTYKPRIIDLTKDERKLFKQRLSNELLLFRFGLYIQGINIGFAKQYELERKGYINESNRINKGFSLKNDFTSGESNKEVEFLKSRLDNNTPENPYAISNLLTEVEILGLEETIRKKDIKFRYFGKRVIMKFHWDLKDELFNYSTEFHKWINEVNSGWQNVTKNYYKYELYKAQAYHWLYESPITFNPLASLDEQLEMVELERNRMLENSLYGTTKILKLKDDKDNRGFIDYNAWEAQAFILYLLDCNLSALIGKLRQIGFTSTIAGAAIIKTMLTKSFYCKLVAQKGRKSEEIFMDKVKFPISTFPNYIRPSINNDTTNMIIFAKKIGKGKMVGMQSKFHVDNPYPDVINAGTPSLVLLDESGLMDELSTILAEGRPTMFRVNPVTQKMEMSRQQFAWGTGGSMKGGGSAFKNEMSASMEAWADKDFRHGMIPVFINAFAKPGMSKEFYEAEKSQAYRRRKQPGKEDPKIIFHYTYPITQEDMFLTSSDTIIPITSVNAHIARIAQAKRQSKIGYFEPIYDRNKTAGEFSDVPYEIIGAKFIPVSDDEIIEDSPLACVEIIDDRDEGWVNRYYQGTDPINSETGHSHFSSAIWDEERKRISCLVDFRHADYRFCYLQSLLMGLYYGFNKPVDELLEINIGSSYYDYCREKGFAKKFMKSYHLPDHLTVSGASVGISKKGHNAKYILNILEELVHIHGASVDSVLFWKQIKTFVRKVSVSGTTDKYGPNNRNVDRDDHLDGATYAYFLGKLMGARRSRQPKKIINEKSKVRYKMKYSYDANYNLELKRVKVNG